MISTNCIVDLTYISDGDSAVQVANAHNKGWFATAEELETAYPVGTPGDYAVVGTTDTIWVWSTSGTPAWINTSEGGLVTSVNDKTGAVVLRTFDVGVTTMPEANASYEDKVLQYVGETTENFTQGSFYVCERQNGNFVWSYLPITEGAVHLDGDETITGMKNFTGEVCKNGNKLISVYDVANESVPGVGKVNPATYGVGLDATTQNFYVQGATTTEIQAGTTNYKAITPANFKAALDSYFKVLTQQEYDAITTKDPNVFYMIKESI